jgi:general stress protein 26
MSTNDADKAGREESIKKLWSMMRSIKVAMLTTASKDGTLRSRPMMSQTVEFDGNLWFFTGKSTPKVHEIQQRTQVNVSYADPGDSVFVSLSGPVETVTDRATMETFWDPAFEAWFPKGLHDPELMLLKVHVEQAEYWDAPQGRMVQMVGMLRALATGEKVESEQMGENKKLQERKGELRPVRRTLKPAKRSGRTVRKKARSRR